MFKMKPVSYESLKMIYKYYFDYHKIVLLLSLWWPFLISEVVISCVYTDQYRTHSFVRTESSIVIWLPNQSDLLYHE